MDPHTILGGKNFWTVRTGDWLFVILMSLSVLVYVGIIPVADLTVSYKYPELRPGTPTPGASHLYY